MTEKLTDPSKPAHEIIEVLEDGDAIRNDGVRLTAANKNPWYVLATIYGELGEGPHYDKNLAAKNRRAWNGWFCDGLSSEERADRAKKAGLDDVELAPLMASERAAIEQQFSARMMNAGVKKPIMPDPAEKINFSKVFFPNTPSFQNFVFEETSDFRSAYFENGASYKNAVFVAGGSFDHAVFKGGGNFVFSIFEDDAGFRGAKFYSMSEFGFAIFRGITDFYGARFGMGCFFGATTFETSVDFSTSKFTGGLLSQNAKYNGGADFSNTEFYEEIYFGSAQFKSITKFNNARFFTHVPEFHAAELYDDTVFPASIDQKRNWPPLHRSVQLEGRDVVEESGGQFSLVETNESVNVMPAADQKRAYNRLRLFMNRSLQIDEEQFFNRQEMRCKREVEESQAMRLLYDLFEGVSDFGSSVLRPAGWLFVVWLSGMIAKLEAVQGEWYPDWHSVLSAMGWSFANMFSFFGFHKRYFGEEELNAVLQVTGGVQTVLGFILLFFLGLGLRNRFRLR